MDSFVAGLLGGYYVFGTSKSSVNQQIVIYVFARVILALAKLSIQPPGDNALIGAQYGGRGGMGVIKMNDETRERIRRAAWPVFASVSWASVMWLFRWYPEMLQPSLKSSMTYMFVATFSFCSHSPVSSSPTVSYYQQILPRASTDSVSSCCTDMITQIIGIHFGISFGITNRFPVLNRSIPSHCLFLCCTLRVSLSDWSPNSFADSNKWDSLTTLLLYNKITEVNSSITSTEGIPK